MLMTDKEFKLKLDFIKLFGWEKIKGFRINVVDFPIDYDYYYLSSLEGYVDEVEFFQNDPDWGVFEDIDEVIGTIEDYQEIKFEDWKKNPSSVEIKESRVVNIKCESFDVFIGRPSKWGNPFKIGIDGSRGEVVEKYEEWIRSKPELLKALPELKGKRLGCYCKPLPCHGDVLLKLLKEVDI